jgi:anti-sigma factor RsiW
MAAVDPAPSAGARDRAAAERKLLRRTRVELSSGGRCERAERVFSDQLDGLAAPGEERFLAAHLARCRRCREHVSELAIAGLPQARRTLDPPRPRAHLRPVPAPLLLEPAPPSVHAELVLVEEPVQTVTEQPAPAPLDRPARDNSAPDRPPPTPAHVAVRHMGKNPAIPVFVAALVAIGLIVLAIVLLQAFNNGDSHAHAPWANPHAPVVHPTPLTDQ